MELKDKEYLVTITEKDHALAQRLHLRLRGPFKVLLVLLALAWLYATIETGRTSLFQSALFWALLGVGVFFIAQFTFILPFRWGKIYRSNKLLRHEQTYRFREDAFEATSEIGSTRIPWSDLHKWAEGKEIILLYQASNLFFLVPKRIFSDEQELKQVRKLLSKGLDGAA